MIHIKWYTWYKWCTSFALRLHSLLNVKYVTRGNTRWITIVTPIGCIIYLLFYFYGNRSYLYFQKLRTWAFCILLRVVVPLKRLFVVGGHEGGSIVVFRSILGIDELRKRASFSIYYCGSRVPRTLPLHYSSTTVTSREVKISRRRLPRKRSIPAEEKIRT